MKLSPHKQGDSFVFNINLTDAANAPIIYTIPQMKSQIRSQNNSLVAEVLIQITAEPGVYTLSVVDTTKWPLGELYLDVKISNGSTITSTETITIPVIKGVTQI